MRAVRMRSRRLPRILPVTVVALAAGLLLTSCAIESGPSPEPEPTETATETEAPAVDPTLLPEGTAADNLPYFDLVIAQLLAGNAAPDGPTVINTLAAAGFDKAAMQLTQDTTPTGLAADALTFSVHWQQDCLVGQLHGDYQSTVSAELSGGGCLIGQTRTIDW